MATSKPFLEGDAATRISPICCSKLNAWRSPRPNSSFFRKQPKMLLSTNSCAEPIFLTHLFSKTRLRSKAFGSTPETWLHMQLAYDLAAARKDESKIKVRR